VFFKKSFPNLHEAVNKESAPLAIDGPHDLLFSLMHNTLNKWSLKLIVPCSVKMLGSSHPVTWCHIPKNGSLNFQLTYCNRFSWVRDLRHFGGEGRGACIEVKLFNSGESGHSSPPTWLTCVSKDRKRELFILHPMTFTRIMHKSCFIELGEGRANNIVHRGRSFQKFQWKITFFFFASKKKEGSSFILFYSLPSRRYIVR